MNMMMMGKGKGKGMTGKMGGQMKPGDWRCPGCGDHQFAKNSECRKCGTPKPSQSFGMKAGDWNCPNCQDLQFAKNNECRKCGTANPDPEGTKAALEAGLAAGFGGIMEKPGDWYCPGCADLQFARNQECRKCGTANPDPEASAQAASSAGNGVSEKPGDWYCPGCNDLQFARNQQCRKCGTPNPDPTQTMAIAMANGASGGGKGKDMKPGDWHCSSCGDLQFAKNTSCRKCGSPNFAAMMMGMIGMDGSSDMMGQMVQAQMMGQLMSGNAKGGGKNRNSPYW